MACRLWSQLCLPAGVCHLLCMPFNFYLPVGVCRLRNMVFRFNLLPDCGRLSPAENGVQASTCYLTVVVCRLQKMVFRLQLVATWRRLSPAVCASQASTYSLPADVCRLQCKVAGSTIACLQATVACRVRFSEVLLIHHITCHATCLFACFVSESYVVWM